MKTTPGLIPRLFLVLVLPLTLTFSSRALAQNIAAVSPDAAPADPLSAQQLDQLLGPIALYPDALIAIILPAATTPADIVLASRYLTAAGTQAEIDTQNWSDAVQALAHYPELVKWMDTNLQWTAQVGNAFVTQQADVMGSIQRLRAIARANGSLVTTAQQQVIVMDGEIEIQPAQPDVIYVPRYDPEVVYDEEVGDDYYDSSAISYGVGFPVGLWLDYNFDWRGHRVWVGDHRHTWRDYQTWQQHPSGAGNSAWHQWRPPAHRPQPPQNGYRPPTGVVRPRPLPGAPARPTGPRHPGNGQSRPNPPHGSSHPPSRPSTNLNQGPAVNTRVAPPQPRVAPPMQRVAAPESRVAPPQSRVAVPESRVAAPTPRVGVPQTVTPPPAAHEVHHLTPGETHLTPGQVRTGPLPGKPVAPPVRKVALPPPVHHEEESHDKDK